MWCFVTWVFNWILDPSKICIKKECMDQQVAPLFYMCPEQESCGEWEQQQKGLKSCVTMGVLARWLFGAEKQSLACPSVCSNFDKNMFLITGSQWRICPWEWQKLQLEEGSDRIRGRTKRSGFHLCAVALSGLKYKKQFCYGRFLECPWQKWTEAYGLLWRYPPCFKQIVLAYLWQYLSSPIPHSGLAS